MGACYTHKAAVMKPMSLFTISILLAIASSALYHFSARSTPAQVNFPVSLGFTYLVALVITLGIALLFPSPNGVLFELRRLNWASLLLGIAIVGIEFGFLLVYRSGWNLGLAAVFVNVAASLILVPVAILLFKDRFNWVNVLGVLVCLAGLLMLIWRR